MKGATGSVVDAAHFLGVVRGDDDASSTSSVCLHGIWYIVDVNFNEAVFLSKLLQLLHKSGRAVNQYTVEQYVDFLCQPLLDSGVLSH